MTTSGSYSFSVSRDDIIRQAMLNLGKLGEGETPTASEVDDCARLLNMLVKQWQGRADFAPGLKTWTRKRGYLFLSGTSGQYTVGPGTTGWTNSFVKTALSASALAGDTLISVDSTTGFALNAKIGIVSGGTIFWTTIALLSPLTLTDPLTDDAESDATVYVYTDTGTQPLNIEAVVLRDSYDSDTPVRIMEQRDYDMLPNKADPRSASEPQAIYHEFHLTNSYIFTDCWGSTDMTQYLVITYLESVQDFTTATDTPYYPQEWYLPLCWGLTEQAAPMFHVAFTQDMRISFKESLAIAQKKEPEKQTLYYQPGDDDL